MPSITRRILTAVGLVALSVAFTPRSMAQSTAAAASPAANSQAAPGTGDDQLYRVGGPVSSPELIHKVEPKFTAESRAEKFSGTVTVNLIVGTNGVPQRVRVIRGVGHGLDEIAFEAVKKYRFKPAMLDGRPVPVQVNVEINFDISEPTSH